MTTLDPRTLTTEDDSLACPYCGGSGHKDDIPALSQPQAGEPVAGGWSYSINYGPEGAWTRDDLARGLAMLDGTTLREVKSTAGDADDANNWREYLGRSDDLLSHLSAASRCSDCPPVGYPTDADCGDRARKALTAAKDAAPKQVVPAQVTDAMVGAAYDAFTRSFASSPIGTNNTRNDLRAALTAAISAGSQPALAVKGLEWQGRCGMLIDLIEHINATGESVEGEDLDMVETFKVDLAIATSSDKNLAWEGFSARSSLGDLYEVARLSSSVWQTLWNGTAFPGWRSTEAEAKAAAQADYETRIRSALSGAPATAFTAAIDTDNSLQAAAREAGWALMELINKIDWTKRHQVEGIITRLGAALSAEKPTKPIICDVLTIQHSSGFPDHFTRIRVGDRQLTTYISKIKGQCGYHAAEFDWLLNGADKPDILAFNYDEPEGLAEYLKAITPATADGWRTMDSAPKDDWSIPILVCQIGEAPDWYGNQLCADYSSVPCTAYWNDAGDCWTFVERPHDVCEPTHWQPIPAAPTATGGR